VYKELKGFRVRQEPKVLQVLKVFKELKVL
jgi:hypothetical protein